MSDVAHSPLILVAEDDPQVRHVIVNTLKHDGLRTLTAEDGNAAFNLAVEQSPALILLDIVLPGVDGYTALGQLREHPATREIPVITLSGLEGPHYQKVSQELGAVGHLAKPFRADDLIQMVRMHLPAGQRGRTISARLGEILVAQDLVSKDALLEVLHRQETAKRPIGEILVEMGVLTREQLNRALSDQLGIPYVELSDEMVDVEVARAFPEELLRRHQTLPIIKVGNELTLVQADPTNERAVADIRTLTRADVTVAFTSPVRISELLDRVFPPKTPVRQTSYREICPPGYNPPDVLTSDASGMAMVASIFLSAVREKLTEIRIEPLENDVRIRHRVRGVLVERGRLSLEMARSLASTLRDLAGLGEAPGWQTSRFRTSLEGHEFDVEILFLPTHRGDAITIVLWRHDRLPPDLADLGRTALSQLLRSGRGLFLVSSRDPMSRAAGLYAVAQAAADKGKQIVAIERLTAFDIPSMIQVEANEQFEDAVTALLSHPPEVILVEDVSTAEVCLAALRSAAQCVVVGGLPFDSAAAAWQHLVSLHLPPQLLGDSVGALLSIRREPERWSTELWHMTEETRQQLFRGSVPWRLSTF